MSESYQGVKFNVVIAENKQPEHALLHLLKKWCSIFHEYNLAPAYSGGSYGNLSFRTNSDNFIITGTCMRMKKNLEDECFVEVIGVDIHKKVIRIRGTRYPSSETILHDAIYKNRPDVNAVFHGHSSELLAYAKLLEIPVTAKEEPYGTCKLVKSVIKIIGNHSIVIMKNHGFISLNSDMEKAGLQCLKALRKIKQY